MEKYNDNDIMDDLGNIIRAHPDENFVDIRVEMSSFRTMLLMFANLLLKKGRISAEEHEQFCKVYDITVRGDVFGTAMIARCYKNRIALANSKPPEKDKPD